MWIARDKGHNTVSGKIIVGDLHLFIKKPKRKIPKGQEWLVKSGMDIEEDHWEARCAKMKLPNEMYNDITWEDEPVEVDLDIIYDEWDINIFKYLNKIKNITEQYKNPLINDSGGSIVCEEINNEIIKLLKILERK